MSSLFAPPPDVVVGQHYIDIAIDAGGIPDPMRRVRVASIDDTGMIRLVSAISGLGGMERTVSKYTLELEYKKED